MLIDWFTVGAQALNFLILVWLLKRFLYKPILNAIDAREKRIASGTGRCRGQEGRSPEGARRLSSTRTRTFDRERAGLLSKATDEAKAERQRLLDDARKAADVAERQTPAGAAGRRRQPEPGAAPADRAGSVRHRAQGADRSGRHEPGRTHDRGVRRPPARAGRPGQGPAWPLPSRRHRSPPSCAAPSTCRRRNARSMQKALNETFSTDIHLRFETAPDLVSGIELTANGQKLAWSIADYLSSLEKAVGRPSEGEGRAGSQGFCPQTAADRSPRQQSP